MKTPITYYGGKQSMLPVILPMIRKLFFHRKTVNEIINSFNRVYKTGHRPFGILL